MIPLDKDSLLLLDARAGITYRGRALVRSERVAVLRFGERDFLEAFHDLSPEEQTAVRLRYGGDTYRWYREEWRGVC